MPVSMCWSSVWMYAVVSGGWLMHVPYPITLLVRAKFDLELFGFGLLRPCLTKDLTLGIGHGTPMRESTFYGTM